jgi:hypothetical protein
VGGGVVSVHRPGILQDELTELVLPLAEVGLGKQLHGADVALVVLEHLLAFGLRGLGLVELQEREGEGVARAGRRGRSCAARTGQLLRLLRAALPAQEAGEEVPGGFLVRGQRQGLAVVLLGGGEVSPALGEDAEVRPGLVQLGVPGEDVPQRLLGAGEVSRLGELHRVGEAVPGPRVGGGGRRHLRRREPVEQPRSRRRLRRLRDGRRGRRVRGGLRARGAPWAEGQRGHCSTGGEVGPSHLSPPEGSFCTGAAADGGGFPSSVTTSPSGWVTSRATLDLGSLRTGYSLGR